MSIFENGSRLARVHKRGAPLVVGLVPLGFVAIAISVALALGPSDEREAAADIAEEAAGLPGAQPRERTPSPSGGPGLDGFERPAKHDGDGGRNERGRRNERGARNERGKAWLGVEHPLIGVRRHRTVTLALEPGGEPVARIGPRTEFGSPTVLSVVEIRRGWAEVSTPLAPDNGTLWAKIDGRRMLFEMTDVSVHANLTKRRIEVRRGGEVVREFAITIGSPSSSTPVGQFAVTDIFAGGLNPVYGCCAIAISAHQSSLPPGWIGGDRVAIHGSVGPVGSASSNGCLRAEDEDARALTEMLPLGAPVSIGY